MFMVERADNVVMGGCTMFGVKKKSNGNDEKEITRAVEAHLSKITFERKSASLWWNPFVAMLLCHIAKRTQFERS